MNDQTFDADRPITDPTDPADQRDHRYESEMTSGPAADQPIEEPVDRPADEPVKQPVEQVEVRRNVVLSGIVGVVAAALTVAFAFRVFGDSGGAIDWALFAVLGVITVLHVAAVADARAPLLVADRLGVRLREGADWQGIAWDDIECMEHLPRRLPLHDGHLLVVGESGQQLIVPLTLATRVLGADDADSIS